MDAMSTRDGTHLTSHILSDANWQLLETATIDAIIAKLQDPFKPD